MILKNVKVVLENEIIENGFIEIENEIIKDYGQSTNKDGLDLKGKIVMPGYIDIHSHGGYGYDFQDGTIESFSGLSKNLVKEGVTAFCPGNVATEMSRLKNIYQNFSNFIESKNYHSIPLGIYAEGPFLTLKYKGAHDPALIKECKYEILKEMLSSTKYIKYLVYTPEAKEDKFIELATKNNIILSMGHSNATYQQGLSDVKKYNIKHLTHLYNAMSPHHHRNPGLVTLGLSHNNLLSELITDGIHVNEDVCKMTYDILGPNNITIITDAMSAKGLKDGEYKLGELKVTKKGKTVTLEDGTIAGASSTYDQNVRNMYRITNCKLTDLIKMTSINVAKEMKIYKEMGSIEKNKLANLVITDKDLNVETTIVKGKILFSNKKD
ncbi:N-acetylglucosamine-6-phosphate deacetylase [Spiroplasma endosymbiont of Anurida maritima]|uniref:N-acetylglucosamine-6-phosphate deacetylase n=1 Tax=Spiroplasma endosymbiont of Anurida maritima TaxID=2967972 RepID=UPI0036D3680A